ncbi:ABC transporter ATP-binding protein [Paenibacillus sp. YIM B09110]|uniref:ABC transporter ATP-binding protein n=1 Tax=Paenibacillus sp. YIM B09110 TaxID=3126102 RepID=UPI00301DD5B5
MLYQIEKRSVLILAAALLISVPIMPLELLLVKTIIDRIQAWSASAPISPILWASGWLGLLMFVNSVALGAPIPLAMTRLNEVGTLEEQRLIMRKTSSLPLATIESAKVKDMRERALRVSVYEIYHTGTELLQLSMQLLVLIIVIIRFGQWLPVIAVIASAILLVYVSGISVGRIEQMTRMQSSDRRLLRHYSDLMTIRNAAKEIRLFDLGDLLSDRWTALMGQTSKHTLDAVRSTEGRKVGPELLMALLTGLLLALVVLMPGAKLLSAGHFAFLFLALTTLLSQLPSLIRQGVAMRTHYMKWEDFQAYLNLDEVQPKRSDREVSAAVEEKVEEGKPFGGLHLQVSNLHFGYPGNNRDAIRGISFAIPPNSRVALVGENGSGKSTLVKLLLGLYSPTAGEIVWSRLKADRIVPTSAEGNVSVVFQDFTRLMLTLRENVALGQISELMNDKRLHQSLHEAGSRFEDLSLQLGVPFEGIEPSGGEWQKIATARAILNDAEFVLFDEPTAALDPKAEKDAFELFLRASEGRSALLVTHRLGADKMVDFILVMKEGQLVEQGTHKQLMERDGLYSHMYQLQAKWYTG